MSSREQILGRIRQQLGRTPENAASGRAEIERYILARSLGPHGVLKGDLLSRFCEKSASLSSSVDLIDDLAQAPAAIARYLAAHQLPRQAVCWPQFASLDWIGAGLQLESRPVCAADLVGVSGCFCALAETGTLVLCSGPETPAALSLLPETHIAIVPIARIVAGMEEAWALLRRESAELPRAVNFVSGPSRTGDIEQTIVLGAHGPYRVHILVVGDE